MRGDHLRLVRVLPHLLEVRPDVDALSESVRNTPFIAHILLAFEAVTALRCGGQGRAPCGSHGGRSRARASSRASTAPRPP
eukprot:137500-Rhodomonas_salina.1